MRRREFFHLAAGTAAALAFDCPSHALANITASHPHVPIIDAHIHLFDPTRPGGVIWPEKGDTICKPTLPARYESFAAAFGVVGAIAIEASPLASDNDWLLGVAAHNPIMVGVIGDLVPATPSYLSELDRLHANPLFLGFRYGNLWNRDLIVDLAKPGFVDGLKALAQAGLVFESANPNPQLIRALVEVSERVPGLRIVADHLPNAQVPENAAAQHEYQQLLRQLAANPSVYVKLSEIPVVRQGSLIRDPGFYRGKLDPLWELFGENRVLFGSDWPNSDHVAPFADTLSIVHAYIAGKSAAAAEKYFWKNSQAAYRWHSRRAGQPAL
jgi:L-fuconolactonase